MRKTSKTVSLCLCAALFATSALTPVYAANHIPSKTTLLSISSDYLQMNDEELIQIMRAYDYSPSEIEMLLEAEHARVAANKSQMAQRGFPSNPQIGDHYTSKVQIHFDTAVTGAASIATLLVAGNVPAAVAIVVADMIWKEYQHNLSATGVAVTIDYVYGYTNDGILGWNAGETNFRFLY